MILLLSAAWAACEQTSDNAALTRGVDAAMEAFTAMEDDSFASARKAVLASVPCLEEPVRPEVAAAVHRIRGLNSFIADDSLTAQLYFAAARSIDPSYRFPESVAPEGHPLNDDYLALDAAADRTETLPELIEGSLFINGKRTRERSTNYPILFQHVDAADGVLQTVFVDAGADLPLDAAAFKVPDVAPTGSSDPVGTKKKKKKGPSVPLVIVAGVLGAAAGGLVVGNRIAKSGYDKHYDGLGAGATQADIDAYDGKRNGTNTLGYAAVGVGVGALGIGVTSFVVNGRF